MTRHNSVNVGAVTKKVEIRKLHTKTYKVSCGLDVHKEKLTAAIVYDDTAILRNFFNSTEDLLELVKWLEEHKVEVVGMESTGIYYLPVYLALEDKFDVIVGNSWQIKCIPRKKSDDNDAIWLGQIVKMGLINPSYIPEEPIRELRELVRLRTKHVEVRTRYKNKVKSILFIAEIKLGQCLTDIFGKAGLTILRGLAQGKTIEEIIATSNSKFLAKKQDKIKQVISKALTKTQQIRLESCINMIETLNEEIATLDNVIHNFVVENSGQEKATKTKKSRKKKLNPKSAKKETQASKWINAEAMSIVTSMPGVGETTGVAVLAELGNLDRFEESKNVLSWAGVVPNVTETAGRTTHGKIKKSSSSWLRRTLHLIAQGVRSKGSECLKEFYNKIKQKHGSFKALVALSRKILKILYHMLKKHEMYNESKLVSGFDNKYRRVRKSKNALDTLQKSYSISVA